MLIKKKIQIKDDKDLIVEKLSAFYILAKEVVSEEKFQEFYNNKTELNKLKEKYPDYYKINYEIQLEKFRLELAKRNKDSKTKLKKIDKFFKDNFDKIFDLDEIELNKKLETYLNGDINLKKIKNENINNKAYFENKLKEFTKKKVEETIINNIKVNHSSILKISSDQDNFKINMNAKLRENENIKKYLDLENEDYKTILDKYCLDNSRDILKDFEDKNMKQKNSVNDFFLENNKELSELYKNTPEEEIENAFEQFLIQKGKQEIKNYSNFKIIKNNKFDQLKNEKLLQIELDKNSKKDELNQFFDFNYQNASDSCKDETEFKQKIEEFLISQNKQELKNFPDYNQVLGKNLESFKKDKEILKNEVIDFFKENYQNLFDESGNEEEFKAKIEQKLSEQNKEKLKKSLNFEPILGEKVELFKKEKEYKVKEKEIINKFISNFTEENFEDKATIEKFKNFLTNETANSICEHIITSGNFNSKIENQITNYTNELLNDDTVKVRHLNIILCGNSGSGKSTLINNILKLEGNKKLLTGVGEHQTEKIEYVESQNVPYMRCADSRGTETGYYNIHNVKRDIIDFINKQKATGDPDKYIHCIWYCSAVVGHIFFGEEDYFIKDLESLYTMKTLPVIIVGTKDISGNA